MSFSEFTNCTKVKCIKSTGSLIAGDKFDIHRVIDKYGEQKIEVIIPPVKGLNDWTIRIYPLYWFEPIKSKRKLP